MLTRWSDFERTFAAVDELRRYLNWLGEPGRQDTVARAGHGYTWPRVNLFDNGSELVLQMAAPGLSEKNVELTLTGDTLAVSGEREVKAPEGYSVHRQERGSVKFSRSFALPSKIDPERVDARMKDGIMTVTMAKAEEAKPRQITVKAR